MRLTIHNVDMPDFGSYKCVAKNSLGDTDGVIKLYRKCSSDTGQKWTGVIVPVVSMSCPILDSQGANLEGLPVG